MGKTPIKHTLAGYIIKKTDTEGYRSGKLTGEKHLNKITEMMEKYLTLSVSTAHHPSLRRLSSQETVCLRCAVVLML